MNSIIPIASAMVLLAGVTGFCGLDISGRSDTEAMSPLALAEKAMPSAASPTDATPGEARRLPMISAKPTHFSAGAEDATTLISWDTGAEREGQVYVAVD